jgi:hypothetical protein
LPSGTCTILERSRIQDSFLKTGSLPGQGKTYGFSAINPQRRAAMIFFHKAQHSPIA